MPTEKPRITITMSQEELKKINDYRYDHRLKNQTQAILSLVSIGLEEIAKKYPNTQSDASEVYSKEEKELIESYRVLSQYGQKYVRETLKILKRAEQVATHERADSNDWGDLSNEEAETQYTEDISNSAQNTECSASSISDAS